MLYVAGLPRTGSTVLGKMLGDLPDSVFVGELALFWRRYGNRELCSCGCPLPECPFWSQIVDEAFGNLTPARVREFTDLERHVLRRQWFLSLTPLSLTAMPTKQIGSMCEERKRLYLAISRVSGAQLIVDSGKKTVYGSIISRITDLHLQTIHIVRDPRGVAFSWQKRVQSDSEPGHMPQRPAVLTASHWLVQNLVIQFLLRRLSEAYVRVRYESLVTNPNQVIADISESLDSSAELIGSSPCGTPEDHMVAGNPGVRRLGKNGLQLTLDEQWRMHLPRFHQRLIAVICGPLMTVYRYDPRPSSLEESYSTSNTGQTG